SELPDRIPLEIFETHLEVSAPRNEPALVEEDVVHQGITENDPLVIALWLRPLQVGVPHRRIEIVLERLKHGVRVAVDMDKPRVWEHLEKQADAGGVRRRLPDKRLCVLQRQLSCEPEKRGFPLVDLVLRHAAKCQVSLVVALAAREGRAEI